MNTGRMRCIKNNGMKRNGKRIAGLMRVLMLSILMMLTLAVPAMAQTDGQYFSWGELDTAINGNADREIVLEHNYQYNKDDEKSLINGVLIQNRAVCIKMNGHVIDGDDAARCAFVITDGADVTIEGGQISLIGNEETDSIGVDVQDNSMFTMVSGKITADIAVNCDSGSAVITGGRIKGALIKTGTGTIKVQMPATGAAPIFSVDTETLRPFCDGCIPTANTDAETKDDYPTTVVLPEPDPVLYSDPVSGKNLICKSYTAAASDTTVWNGGWYVVRENVTIAGSVTTTGNVNLILCDGAKLTASMGITGGNGSRLTIYGQSGGTGTLSLAGTNADISVGTLTICGGRIAGGSLCTGMDSVTISGGQIDIAGIKSAGSVTLGCASPDDYILVGGYDVPGTISITEGQTLTDGTATYRGTLTSEQAAAIARKTLRLSASTYTVTFVDGQGNTLKTETVASGNAATAPRDPVRDGYTFTGWDKAFNKITADTKVTAQWAKLYTVTFVDGQGKTLKTEKVESGKAATAPSSPTRDGYTFTGWDKDFSKITADTTVTAQWKKNDEPKPVTYTVTFVDGQGKTLKTETVESGKAATAPSSPTREGYTFTGWDKAFSKITADTTVTAQWKKNADPAPAPVSIKDAKVLLSAESFTYTGKIRKPEIKTVAGKALKEGTDYTAKWSNEKSKDAGTYTITITGKGGYTGTTKAAYKITKAANPLKIKGNTARIKYSKLKKKNQTLAVKKVIKVVKKGKGKLTYKKVSGSKKITINTKTGKVTVKKGLKKGKYKVKVKVKAAGNKNYKASKAKKATFTIVVK